MESNPELVIYLRGLSPFFEKLIEGVSSLEIALVNQEEYFVALSPFIPDVRRSDRFTVFGARDFRHIGLAKIIVFDIKAVQRYILDGSPGFCELSFAHELGHILSDAELPSCNNRNELQIFQCEYAEARADLLALEMVRQLHPDGNKALFMYKHQPKSPKELWYLARRSCYFPCGVRRTEASRCEAIAFHKLSGCPKIIKIREMNQSLNFVPASAS